MFFVPSFSLLFVQACHEIAGHGDKSRCCCNGTTPEEKKHSSTSRYWCIRVASNSYCHNVVQINLTISPSNNPFPNQERKWMRGDKLKCHHWNNGCKIFPTFGDPLKRVPDSCKKHKGIERDKVYTFQQLEAYMAQPATKQATPPKGKPTKFPPNADCNNEEEILQTSVEESNNDEESEENLF